MSMNKQRPRQISLEAFDKATEDQRNRMLLEWLSDDGTRCEFFKLVNVSRNGKLGFPSRDAAPREPDGLGYDQPRKDAVPGHMPVTLVTERSEIERILLNMDGCYSSRVYAELGGGSFMLALDPAHGGAHAAQREAFHACFDHSEAMRLQLGHAACEAAAVMAFRAPDFDLADFAEQAALRYCQLLMGYAFSDFRLLELTMRAAYRALVHQVYERHFVTDPTAIAEAKPLMGRLLTRTSALIDGYLTRDEDVLKGCDDPARPHGLKPVLERLGTLASVLNGEQRAIVALGAAIGMVGNVQAAVCIAVEGLFADREQWQKARNLALDERTGRATENLSKWQPLLAPALRVHPPIPYLPRIEINVKGEKVAELLLALGGGTADWPDAKGDDPLVWGLSPPPPHGCAGPAAGPGDAVAPHWCVGQALAWPLIVEVVRQVMSLPGLAQALDPETGEVHGLEKRRGFACESYPFTHRRDRHRAQTSLNVAMRIKAPVKEHVDRVREVIRAGAPQIERLLRESRHVHFAWFELIEADTVLVLHTVYDGPFGAYLQHFALQAGDLFDVLFEHIEDPPPMPVRKFPTEFAAHLLRYNRAPAMGYFFSAYPTSEVARIVRNEGRG